MTMNSCTPELPVADVAGAMRALRPLGFRDGWTFDDVFGCVYAGDDVEIFLRKHPHPAPVTLYFKVDDADALVDRYRAHAEITIAIHDTPWGMREFVARVTDGHLFRIGHGAAQAVDRRVVSS